MSFNPEKASIILKTYKIFIILSNTPNWWDGVPQDELDKHKMKYDEKTLAQCIKPEERNDIMNWDNFEIG
jgi:hypothetical protein